MQKQFSKYLALAGVLALISTNTFVYAEGEAADAAVQSGAVTETEASPPADQAAAGAADAEPADDTCHYTCPKGEFTTNHPVLSRTVTLPLRLATAAVGGTVGAVGGLFKGAYDGVYTTNEYTFGNMSDTPESLAPLWVPVGLVAAPVGLVGGGLKGMITGSCEGKKVGFFMPDAY